MVKIIAIVGPTAVGKTKLSIELAHQLNGEIISGDSMQIYRHLDIGTAKITPTEMDGITHHLINIKNANERFSVADFQSLAGDAIVKIVKRGKQPIIVGGTGFYLQSLTENLMLGADQFDEQSLIIRQKWHKFVEQYGNNELWQRLKKLDPISAQKIPVNNVRRVIRALEVTQKTGRPFSDQKSQQSDFDFKLIGLTTARPILYQRINQRVDLMMQTGLLKEAQWLYDQNGRQLQAGKGIGYHELFDYFDQLISLDQAVANIKQDSRHYAKRQLTWFRNKMNVTWFNLVENANSISEINQFTQEWLQK